MMERLNEILKLFVSQLYPLYIKEELREKIIAEGTDKKEVKKYFDLLMWIKNIFEKIQRYELFFEELYPSKNSKLNPDDVLEYHIHNYITDLYILREKICHYLGTLKNDLKKFAQNKEEIDRAVVFLIEETKKSFEKVTDERNPHTHRGKLYLDPGVVESRAMRIILENETFFPKEWDKEKAIKAISQKKEDSFSKSKVSRIELAKQNNKSLYGLIEEVFKQTQKWLYQYLKLENISITKISERKENTENN